MPGKATLWQFKKKRVKGSKQVKYSLQSLPSISIIIILKKYSYKALLSNQS